MTGRAVKKINLLNLSYVLGFLLLSRLIAMFMIPLNDSTEARYGEIARKMLEANDWITLWHDIGVPFWGKPPLAIWLSALSMKVCGVSVFAVRLPALLLSMGVLGLVWKMMRADKGAYAAQIAVLILASSFLFFLAAGTIMTDPALLFSVCLSQVSFWHAVERGNRNYAYLFFVGLALGLLAKGPLTLILAGVPVCIWILKAQAWRKVWKGLPWIKGGLLMLIIALPWYVLAELKTPGFLQYFIMGEHLGRFMTSSWQGDKYGFAHAQAYGMVWLYGLMALLPWSLSLCFLKKQTFFKQDKKEWSIYWWTCFLTPLLLFTFASNIIYPYVLPSLPAFAILFSEGLEARLSKQVLLSLASLAGWGMLVISVMFFFWPQYISHSQDRLVRLWQAQVKNVSQANPLFFWSDKVVFSAQFYSQGHVISTTNLSTVCAQLNKQEPVYVAIDKDELNAFPVSAQFQEVAQVQSFHRTVLLFKNDVLCQN